MRHRSGVYLYPSPRWLVSVPILASHANMPESRKRLYGRKSEAGQDKLTHKARRPAAILKLNYNKETL